VVRLRLVGAPLRANQSCSRLKPVLPNEKGGKVPAFERFRSQSPFLSAATTRKGDFHRRPPVRSQYRQPAASVPFYSYHRDAGTFPRIQVRGAFSFPGTIRRLGEPHRTAVSRGRKEAESRGWRLDPRSRTQRSFSQCVSLTTINWICSLTSNHLARGQGPFPFLNRVFALLHSQQR
jgi:hypothetical protein